MLKATGIIRKIDILGRIVLPKKLRRDLNLEIGSPVEMFIDDDGNVLVKKYVDSCIFCGNEEEVIDYKGKSICSSCLADMSNR